MKTKTLLLFFVLSILNLSAQNEPFINDICLPSKEYMLSGVQNDLFIQTFLKRWRPYDYFVRYSGTAVCSRRYEKVASVSNPETGKVIKVELINSAEGPIHQHNDPLIDDNWEDTQMLDPKSFATFSPEWETVDTTIESLKQFAGWFPYVMQAENPGS